MNISTKLLRALVVLADCRHFTRAAERCNLSQSAFSHLIRRLERDAGVPLFDRNTRNVALTAEGELLAEHARRLLADIDASFAELRDRATLRRGRVAVAALPSLSADLLPRVFARYRLRYPGITLHLFDRLSDPCLNLLNEGRVDFALTAPGRRLQEFDSRLLVSERFYFVCPRTHRLARRRRIALKDVRGEELLGMVRSSSVRQHVDRALGDAVRQSSLEVEQLATLAGLIANGLGVALVPELTLYQFRRDELVCVEVDDANLRRPILAVQRKGVRLSPAAAELFAMIPPLLTSLSSAPGAAVGRVPRRQSQPQSRRGSARSRLSAQGRSARL